MHFFRSFPQTNYFFVCSIRFEAHFDIKKKMVSRNVSWCSHPSHKATGRDGYICQPRFLEGKLALFQTEDTGQGGVYRGTL